MAISFSHIPTTIRTPGVYGEFDASRALQGLAQINHTALIIGQRTTTGTVASGVLTAITNDGLADGYFGVGSVLARMCNVFKDNNPNTELWAVALDDAGAATVASGYVRVTGSAVATGTLRFLVNGVAVNVAVTSGDNYVSICSAVMTAFSAEASGRWSPVIAVSADSNTVALQAKNKGSLGNNINLRINYFTGQVSPSGITISLGALSGGATEPDLDDVWSVIDGQRFNYVVQPYTDATNLTSIETELEDRILPLEDLGGIGFTASRNSVANLSTLGNSRNSYLNVMPGAYDSPTCPEEWAAAWGAAAAKYLNNDPARPLHTIKLKGIMPPPKENCFTRAERDVLLYDGIATWVADDNYVYIERSITTYQHTVLGVIDPTWLDVQTIATLLEIRDQYRIRMMTRYIDPRWKLADNSFPVQPGSFVARPKDVHQEAIALFSLLRDRGLVDNLEEFKNNLVTERDIADVNRVNQLLSPDLVNQFRILAGLIQFIL
uniref:Putative tail sheath protein n=1 Tax=viral metagenome TaxID=1070528 RepID=A0A6M3KZM7_9ZZZZ